MFILKGIEQLEKAIAKAKKIRPRVKFDRLENCEKRNCSSQPTNNFAFLRSMSGR
jgi:hypothetical protein